MFKRGDKKKWILTKRTKYIVFILTKYVNEKDNGHVW